MILNMKKKKIEEKMRDPGPGAREGRHGLRRSSTEDHLHLLVMTQSLFLPFFCEWQERETTRIPHPHSHTHAPHNQQLLHYFV